MLSLHGLQDSHVEILSRCLENKARTQPREIYWEGNFLQTYRIQPLIYSFFVFKFKTASLNYLNPNAQLDEG